MQKPNTKHQTKNKIVNEKRNKWNHKTCIRILGRCMIYHVHDNSWNLTMLQICVWRNRTLCHRGLITCSNLVPISNSYPTWRLSSFLPSSSSRSHFSYVLFHVLFKYMTCLYNYIFSCRGCNIAVIYILQLDVLISQKIFTTEHNQESTTYTRYEFCSIEDKTHTHTHTDNHVA